MNTSISPFKMGILGVIISSFFLFSCGGEQKAKVVDPAQKLYDEVIAIHDDVMPKMSDIHRLKKELRTKMKNDSLAPDHTAILDALKDLDMADDGMMDWMAELKVPEAEPAKTTYLNEQMVAIKKVRDDMLSSIENAKKELSK